MAATPCPHCHAPVDVGEAERGRCDDCGRPLRFVEVPDHLVRMVATCPRCRRRLEVPRDAQEHTCPHCEARMRFQDTF